MELSGLHLDLSRWESGSRECAIGESEYAAQPIRRQHWVQSMAVQEMGREALLAGTRRLNGDRRSLLAMVPRSV